MAQTTAAAVPTTSNANYPTQVHYWLGHLGEYGMTVPEARILINDHHGTISGVMTRLHQKGKIVRLAETRVNPRSGLRAHICVASQHVAGRATLLSVRVRPVCPNCNHRP